MRRLCALLFLGLLATAAFAAENKQPAQGLQHRFTVQPQGQFRFVPRGPDQRGFIALSDNTCYKLQKYVFRREDGSDRTTLVGSTDCTRASRVVTENADSPNPQPTGPGLSKAVMRIRSSDQPDKR